MLSGISGSAASSSCCLTRLVMPGDKFCVESRIIARFLAGDGCWSHVSSSMGVIMGAVFSLPIVKASLGSAQDNAAITPVISETSANFIEGLVKDAESKGATLCQEYKREKNLIWPLLIDHVTQARTTTLFDTHTDTLTRPHPRSCVAGLKSLTVQE